MLLVILTEAFNFGPTLFSPPFFHTITVTSRSSYHTPDRECSTTQVNYQSTPLVPFLSQPSSSTAHIHRISGPDIAVPLSWQQSPASSNPNMVSGAIGYSVHHAQYETITLEISAVYEGNSQKKSGRGINFGNICEGKKDIDTRLDAPGLI
ncbi:hypothetical protein BDR07DRAFT_1488096 [Suillus spraguei]|nr:hypothetical protein BDR07DRAFT_1488096 [Suillus spraguei]